MATLDKGGTVTLQELLVTSLTQTDPCAKTSAENDGSLPCSMRLAFDCSNADKGRYVNLT